MVTYVPGTEDQDPKRVIMSLQQIGPKLDDALTDIATKITGPGSSVDNAAVRYDGTGGDTAQGSVLLIADTTGAISRSGNGGIPVQGTNTNDNATAGDIGEYTFSTTSFGGGDVTLTTATTSNITSISLTAGDWDVSAIVYFESSGAIAGNGYNYGSVSQTSATLDTTSGRYGAAALFTAASQDFSVPLPIVRKSLSSTTTIYLVAQSSFSAGTIKAWGHINARRVR